jgi:SagB-type dehydrogenase family enzyme
VHTAEREQRQRFRLSPRLVLKFGDAEQLEAFLLGDGSYLRAGEEAARALGRLVSPRGFTRDEFDAAWREAGARNDAGDAFDSLRATGFIDPDRHMVQPSEGARFWSEAGWGAARLFHEATLDTPFVQGDPEGWKQQRVGSARITEGAMIPPVSKRYEGLPRVGLVESNATIRKDFEQVLRKRRTCRRFSRSRVLDTATVSTLMHLAARAHGTLRNDFFGTLMLRTSPSGGAMHPVEIYPQTFRVKGLPERSWYYDPMGHELVELGDCSEDDIYGMSQQQSGCRDMPLAFIITARFERNLCKYRYAKSYAFTLLDVGHFAQTLLLCCEAVGLRTFLTPALNVPRAMTYLGLPDPYLECPIYLVAAG